MRIILLSLLFSMALLGCSGPASNTTSPSTTSSSASSGEVGEPGYEITLNLAGGSDTVFLAYYQGDKQFLKDTALNNNGTYTFQREESLDGGMYLMVIPPSNRFFDLVIAGDQYFTITTDTADFAGKMEIEGSEENEIFYEHVAYLGDMRTKATELQNQMKGLADGDAQKEAITEELTELNETVMAERKGLMAKYPGKLAPVILTGTDVPEVPDAPEGAPEDWAFRYYRAHYFDKLDLSDDRLTRTPIMKPKVDEFLDKLTLQDPDTVIAAVDEIIETARPNDEAFKYYVSYLLNKYAEKANKIMGMDAVYLHIVEKYYASNQAWWIDPDALEKIITKAEELSPIIIGRPGQDFTVTDMNGIQQSVYGVDADWLILYFWDYDCGRCKKVTPELASVFPAYRDKGVQLFTVNINGSEDVWKSKLAEYGLDEAGGIHTSDAYRRSGFDAKYNINSTPKLFILDKDKVIRYKWIGVDQLKEILDRELNPDKEEGNS
ncbi:MAG: DUF5106 domain-containing protein [Bacteroidota bacterium]